MTGDKRTKKLVCLSPTTEHVKQQSIFAATSSVKISQKIPIVKWRFSKKSLSESLSSKEREKVMSENTMLLKRLLLQFELFKGLFDRALIMVYKKGENVFNLTGKL